MFIERRKHRRIVPLKSFRRFLILLVVCLAGLSIEVSTRSNGDFGRLMQKEIPRNQDIRPQPPPITTTAPITEQPPPVAPQEQYLAVTPVTPATTTAALSTSDVHVVGDSSGIVIQRSSEAPKRPVLAGGIFKQP